MLVGVNALGMSYDHSGGEQRFLKKVLATIQNLQSATRFVIFTNASNDAAFDDYDRIQIQRSRWFSIGSDTSAQLNPIIKQAGIDLLLSPIADAPAKSVIPTVLFGLDLHQYENDYVEHHRRAAAKLKHAKRVCAEAAVIIAPSEFTRKRHLALLDTPLNKIVVAPLGVDDVFAQSRPPIVECPYFLAVGATREFKNVPRLREAFTLLEKEFPHHLVVAGHPAEAEPAQWGPRVTRIDACPANYLASLYQNADVYIQPSLYEGSGVTVLEAMKAGVPIATSRNGGIEEVAGAVPFYFNPESVPSIVAAVRWAIEEKPEQRQNRLRVGRKLADEYTWERCAWKILSAFKSVQ